MSHHRPPRLTLAQLLLVPVFAAVAMAGVAAAMRSGAVLLYGLPQMILIEAIVLPLGCAIVGQVVLRGGRARDRTVSACLLLSATAAAVALLVLGGQNLWDIGASVASGRGVPVDLLGFTMAIGGGLVGLLGAYRFLLPRIIPARCPSCGRRSLYRHGVGGEAATSPVRTTGMILVCDACGGRVRRRVDGGLADVEDARPGTLRHASTSP